MTEQEQHPDPERWWRHRRRHSYLAACLLIGTTGATFAVDITQAQAEVIGAVVWACLLIIGTYIGACTWDDVSKRVKP